MAGYVFPLTIVAMVWAFNCDGDDSVDLRTAQAQSA